MGKRALVVAIVAVALGVFAGSSIGGAATDPPFYGTVTGTTATADATPGSQSQGAGSVSTPQSQNIVCSSKHGKKHRRRISCQPAP